MLTTLRCSLLAPRRPRWRCFALALVWGLLAVAARADDGHECPAHEAQDLEPGEQLSELAGQASCPNGPLFVMRVPERTTSLAIGTSGGTGNAWLLVKRGAIPTRTSFDFFSGNAGTAQSVLVQSPQAGDWYVQVFPAADFSGVSLAANFAAHEGNLEDGRPVPGLQDGRADDFVFFSINVPPGSASLQVATSGGSGALFLFLRQLNLPTAKAFDAASFNGASTAQSVVIPSPGGGSWKIALQARRAYAGVTLVATVTPGATCLAGPNNLCLLGQRFKIESTWTLPTGASAGGGALPGADQTGAFWFFDPGNTEVVVKVLDGRPVNGHFWVFFGSITDVEYTIRVTDTRTGVVRSYHHDPGNLNGTADVTAF